MRNILLSILIVVGFWVRPAFAQMAPDVAERVLSATLVLRSADGRDSFLGSGFAVDTGKKVLTNAHVVDRATKITVVTQTGERFIARVHTVDPVRDLAVLLLDEALPTILPLAELPPKVGMTVYAAGAPLEAGFTLTQGIVSARERQIEPTQPVGYLQHSAAVNPGSSGGPLVDVYGAMVGVNAQISDGSRFFVGIAYAVPLAEVRDFLAQGPLPVRPAPGVLLRPLTPQMAAALGYKWHGALIEEVLAGSPAARAGLLAGDVLNWAGDREIAKPGDFAFALAQADEAITIVVWRNDEIVATVMDRRALPSALPQASGQAVQRRSNYRLTDMGMVLDSDGTIRAVVAQGASYFAGITGGDRIEAINGTKVSELEPKWEKNFVFDAPILLRIGLPDGGKRHYVLDPWAPHDGLRMPSGANMLDREVVNFD